MWNPPWFPKIKSLEPTHPDFTFFYVFPPNLDSPMEATVVRVRLGQTIHQASFQVFTHHLPRLVDFWTGKQWRDFVRDAFQSQIFRTTRWIIFGGFFLLFTSWWFQPLWKICSSKWVHLPQFSGWKFQKSLKPPPSSAWTWPFSRPLKQWRRKIFMH